MPSTSRPIANILSNRDLYFSHLQSWSYDHSTLGRSCFRGYITLSAKKPGAYKLGQPVRCQIKPIDVSGDIEIYDVLIKLTVQRAKGGKAGKGGRREYRMLISDFGNDWVGEEEWFGGPASKQLERCRNRSTNDMVTGPGAPEDDVLLWQPPNHQNLNDGLRIPEASMSQSGNNNNRKPWILIRPPFPLSRLPMELRLKILVELYLFSPSNTTGGSKMTTSMQKREVHPHFWESGMTVGSFSMIFGRRRNIPNLPLLLQLNQQIRSEISYEVFSTTMFHYRSVRRLLYFLSKIRRQDRLAIRHLGLHLTEEGFLNLFAGVDDGYGPAEERLSMADYKSAFSLLKDIPLTRLEVYHETCKKPSKSRHPGGSRESRWLGKSANISSSSDEDETTDEDEDDEDSETIPGEDTTKIHDKQPTPSMEMGNFEKLKTLITSEMKHVPSITFLPEWKGYTKDHLKTLDQSFVRSFLRPPRDMTH